MTSRMLGTHLLVTVLTFERPALGFRGYSMGGIWAGGWVGPGQPGSDVMPKILRLLCLVAVQGKSYYEDNK